MNEQETIAPSQGLWRTIVGAPEGKILIGGVALACAYMAFVTLASLSSPKLARGLLAMTGAHAIGGRGLGISTGYVQGLKPVVVIPATIVVETFLVLLFYPLFVFSYRKLLVIGPLKKMMAHAQRVAEARKDTIRKYGIPGLMLFVWFPFWMTGPPFGCIIGFLIGLRARVTLAVVLAGTYLAILCWGFVLRSLFAFLRSLSVYIPLAILGVILLVAVVVHISHAFGKNAQDSAEDDEGSAT